MDQKSPDAFRTISEVADWLDTPAHVLRFWESRFAQVKPVKRAGGRRYYRPSDMALLGGIKKLLHEDGLTIRGVQKILRSQGTRYVASLSPPLDDGGAPMVEGAEPAALPPAEVLMLRPDAQAPAGTDSAMPAGTEAAAPAPSEAGAPEPSEPEPAAVAPGTADAGEPAGAPAGVPPAVPLFEEREPEFTFDTQSSAEPVAGAEDAVASSAATEDDGEDEENVDQRFEEELAWALGLDATVDEAGEATAEPARAVAAGTEQEAPSPAPETTQETSPEATTPEAAPEEAPEEALEEAPDEVAREPDTKTQVAAEIAALAPLPADDDPRFAPVPSAFPLRDPRVVRARLSASPAAAAALYARMVDLAARMAERGR